MRRTAARLSCTPALFLLCAGAAADVFPTTAATSGGNTIPFGNPTVYHQVFSSHLFSTPTAGQPALITRVALAPLNNIRYRAGVTVRLGYTSAGPGGLAPPPSSTGGGGAPNAIDPPGMVDFFVAPSFLGSFSNASDTNFRMAFDGVPFVYDPSLGNLLVELVISGPSFGPLQMSSTNAPGESSRAYNNGATGSGIPGSLRMDFTFSAFDSAVTGACCAADGSCQMATLAACQTQGGVYRGNSVLCGSSPCAQPGACCLGDGTCVQLQQAACIAGGGVWSGAGTSCGSVSCAQPGACCLMSGGCAATLEADCTALGAAWQPGVCGSVTCPHVLNSPIPTCPFPTICNSSSAGANAGLYLNLIAAAGTNVLVKRLDFNSNAAVGTPIAVTIWTREGSYVGFDGSTDGWTVLANLNTRSNGTASANPPVHLDLPSPVLIPAGQIRAFCIVAVNGGMRYRTSDPNVSNSELTLTSAVSRTPAFTGAPTVRGLTGVVVYDVVAPPCYANCDGSTTVPILNVNDFICFQTSYAAGCP